MTGNREWTGAERGILRDLGGEMVPPPGLEDRVVDLAAERGLVDRETGPARLRGSWVRAAIAAAAVVALFAAGVLVGSRLAGPVDPEGPRYVFLLYEGPGFDDSGNVAEEYIDWVARMRDQGRVVDGEELGSGASVDRGEGGASAEPPGRPTGYFVVEARDLEEAEAIAREHPHVDRGGVIEVRPIVER